MSQLSLFRTQTPSTWRVTDLTRYLRDLLESDYNLQDLWVEGEISNISRPSSGHLYFTLKDAGASLRCVMWRSAADRLRFLPRDGDAVEVHGRISLYEASGQYQLYADLIRQAGEGVLHKEFLRLKAKLEAEGLFDPERKHAIPAWPRRIGIVTSPTGAALQDMLNTIRRRFPLAEVILAPSPVQGEQAPSRLVKAILDLNELAGPPADPDLAPDVILVARGGGSLEDLWPFNDEFVARAIAASRIPVITGVGHETDFTIADFAADLRAPTPTAAAELATPDQEELRQTVEDWRGQLSRTLQAKIHARRWKLAELTGLIRQLSPRVRIQGDRQRLDDLVLQATVALTHRFQLSRVSLKGLEQQLISLNPLSVLRRGFAVVSRNDGTIIRSVSQPVAGEALAVRVQDGSFEVVVQNDPESLPDSGKSKS